MAQDAFLASIGGRVRSARESLGLSQVALAQRAGLSTRFLSALEHGQGNISLSRFAALARALGVPPARLFPDEANTSGPRIALLGVRGAGKSTLGARLAQALGVPFVELDAAIEHAAGMPLGELFELHGEAYYRRLERDTLRTILSTTGNLVLATGGSLVTDPETYQLLRAHARTVWLRAAPQEHWDRVRGQGDERPMAQNPHAFAELQTLLRARAPLYRQADLTLDTSGQMPPALTKRLIAWAKQA